MMMTMVNTSSSKSNLELPFGGESYSRVDEQQQQQQQDHEQPTKLTLVTECMHPSSNQRGSTILHSFTKSYECTSKNGPSNEEEVVTDRQQKVYDILTQQQNYQGHKKQQLTDDKNEKIVLITDIEGVVSSDNDSNVYSNISSSSSSSNRESESESDENSSASLDEDEVIDKIDSRLLHPFNQQKGYGTSSDITPNPTHSSHVRNLSSDFSLGSSSLQFAKCSLRKSEVEEYLARSASDTITTEQDRQKLIQDAQREIRNDSSLSLAQCILWVVAYIIFSVLAYSVIFERWSTIDSCYFGVTTFTTVGYGDIVPDGDAARIFTCIYALAGVACLGVAVGVIGNHMIESQQDAIDQWRHSNAIKMFETTVAKSMRHLHVHDDDSNNDDDSDGVCDNCQYTPGSCLWFWHEISQNQIFIQLLVIIALLMTIANLIRIVEGDDWTFATTLYFAIVTASTVGYGDFTPETQLGKLLAVFFVPLAVGATGHWLALVAQAIIDERQKKFRNDFEHKELTAKDLQVMDADGDGEVTRSEFLQFMLVAMNKVDHELLDNLNAHFDRLDADGTGTLDKEDLIIHTKRKLEKVNEARKLMRKSWRRPGMVRS